jgi:hypothetical protein
MVVRLWADGLEPRFGFLPQHRSLTAAPSVTIGMYDGRQSLAGRLGIGNHANRQLGK